VLIPFFTNSNAFRHCVVSPIMLFLIGEAIGKWGIANGQYKREAINADAPIANAKFALPFRSQPEPGERH